MYVSIALLCSGQKLILVAQLEFLASSQKYLMFNLLSLPYEVLSNIIANINFDDVFNLGLSCKALKYLLTEESICRLIVQVSYLLRH